MALDGFFGSAAGLSASVITRLTTQWQAEQRAFAERDLSDRDYVYVWADGVHFNVRLDEERLCCLVIVGVRTDGTKELVAITDGYRESTEFQPRGKGRVWPGGPGRQTEAPVMALPFPVATIPHRASSNARSAGCAGIRIRAPSWRPSTIATRCPTSRAR